jgi:hypothetical protein
MRASSLTVVLSITAVAVFSSGCNRTDKNAAPVAQIQTQTPPQAVVSQFRLRLW